MLVEVEQSHYFCIAQELGLLLGRCNWRLIELKVRGRLRFIVTLLVGKNSKETCM